MKSKCSPVDVIPSSIIKLCPDIFGAIISRLANMSFDQCTFPTSYKSAQIRPLLKKPGLDPNDPASYRPISNLSTISKILEKIVLHRLKAVLCTSPNFCRLQSAYQQRHSTETAMLKVMDDVYGNVNKKLGTILVALDISAAFDCVVHDVLLRRLEFCYGVSGPALGWMRSYLEERSQFVKLQSSRSDTQHLDTGVPQGSCLGPFLFCIYVSTLANVIPNNVLFHQYADDTQLYCGISTANFSEEAAIIERCSEAVERWFLRNGMLLNGNKSDAVVLSTRQQSHKLPKDPVIRIAGCNIKVSNSVRSLGVVLDDKLTFDKHVAEICRNCYYHIKAFREIRRFLTRDIACSVARSIVLSRLGQVLQIPASLP